MASDKKAACALPPKLRRNQPVSFVSKWAADGGATWHRDCFESLLSDKSRRSLMSPVERSLFDEAAATAEFFDSDAELSQKVQELVKLLRTSQHTVLFSGAGVSTAAGIGDFRGPRGKWTQEDQGDDAIHVSGGVDYVNLRPTYAHEAFSRLHEDGLLRYIITQNCDSLHRLAGIPSHAISELHGNIFCERCVKCHKEYTRSFYVMDDNDECLDDPALPWPAHMEECTTCGNNHMTGRNCSEQKCGGKLMDTIIHFGDMLPEDLLQRAQQHARECDLMLSFGTTMEVTPACDLVVMGPKAKKRPLVIVNRQKTRLDRRALMRIFGDADDVMRRVMTTLLAPAVYKEWYKACERKISDYDMQRDQGAEWKDVTVEDHIYCTWSSERVEKELSKRGYSKKHWPDNRQERIRLLLSESSPPPSAKPGKRTRTTRTKVNTEPAASSPVSAQDPQTDSFRRTRSGKKYKVKE